MAKPGLKLLHDMTAHEDMKIVAMMKAYGAEGYGRFWVFCELMLQQTDARLDTGAFGFWDWVTHKVHGNQEHVKVWVSDCVDKFALFETDGRFIWSPRLLRDREEFEQRRKVFREAGYRGYLARSGCPPGGQGDSSQASPPLKGGCGQAQALWVKRVTAEELREKSLDQLIQASGLAKPEVVRILRLFREVGPAALSHYTQLAQAHLASVGEIRADFMAYVEAWMRRDIVENKGWFATHTPPNSKSKPYRLPPRQTRIPKDASPEQAGQIIKNIAEKKNEL